MKSKLLLVFLLMQFNQLNASIIINDFCEESYENILDARIAAKYLGFTSKYNFERYSGSMSNQIPDRAFYRGCRYDHPWIIKTHMELCQAKKAKANLPTAITTSIPKAILFFFDGNRDFDAKDGKSLGAVNLDGTEGEDNMFGDRGLTHGLSVLEKWLDSSSQSIHQHRADLELQYYPGSETIQKLDMKTALGCYHQIDSYTDKLSNAFSNIDKPKIMVMGYSNGAFTALRFQADKNVYADLVLTVDPIGYTGFGKPRKRSENTGRLVNFYQKQDYGTMPILKLRGKQVKRADENILIESEESYEAHLEIIKSSLITKRVKEETEKIFATIDNLQANAKKE